mgnify:CR=1 FL=1
MVDRVRLDKNGEDYFFKISKEDCEKLNADESTTFEKIISLDGSQITFIKIDKPEPDVNKIVDSLMEEDSEFMKELSNL